MDKPRYLIDPKKRFSSRVENYTQFRPSYPPKIINFLIEKKILSKQTIIADVGSGTGILSELFLKNGNKVFGVEPNSEMRRAAERILNNYPNFVSISSSAENTSLLSDSIDLITVGQAFHWFDVDRTKKEFKDILKSDGHIVIIWNNRRKSGKGFSRQYEEFILKYGTDYKEVRKNEKKIDQLYKYDKEVFYNFQDLDFEGLKGRLLSVSYIPLEGEPNYENMLKELFEVFNKYKQKGKVRVEYDTEVHYGKME
ncbi:MAG: methyltransferase domain-containing protein [Promethearchaeota archaeon]|jgi:SAM-dependent methyltransferase